MTQKKEQLEELKVPVTTNLETKYTKSNILKSCTYKSRRDILSALLNDTKTYTKEEIEKIINDYLKKKVN